MLLKDGASRNQDLCNAAEHTDCGLKLFIQPRQGLLSPLALDDFGEDRRCGDPATKAVAEGDVIAYPQEGPWESVLGLQHENFRPILHKEDKPFKPFQHKNDENTL